MNCGRLRSADIELSALALGCEPLGGTDWGTIDPDAARRAVRRALDLGVTVFDTADVYGLGRGEEELSRALGQNRHDVVIVTKFGVRWRTAAPGQRAATSRDASAEYVVRALEGSLRRLRVEAVPLYLVHWPDPHTPIEATLGALERAREQGKVRAYGLSNFPADVVNRVARVYPVAAVEGEYSLIRRKPSDRVFPTARQHGLSALAYGPLAQGLLSGRYDETSSFGRSDRRHRLPHFSREQLRRARPLLSAIAEVAGRHEKSAAQVAIRWVIDSGVADVVIAGAKTVPQVEANVGALGWELTNDEMAELDRAAKAKT